MEPLFHFTEILKQREIVDKEQIAIELLRTHLTKRAYEKQYHTLDRERFDEEAIYQVMKDETAKKLGYFPGDQHWFIELFSIGNQINLIKAIQEIFKKDRLGIVLSPDYLVEYFAQLVLPGKIETVLIPEAHKHLNGLMEIVESNWSKQFVLTAEKKWLVELLKLIFEHHHHVKVLHESINSPLHLEQEFDLIISIPAFGAKPDIDTDRFITRESEGIAVENLLDWLSEQGELHIVVPARFTFSGDSFAELRSWILRQFSLKSIFILSEGTLRPYTGMKTYLMTISHEPVEKIQLGKLEMKQGCFLPAIEAEIPAERLQEREDWRIELLIADQQNEWLAHINPAKRSVVKLKEIAELFRGKSIMKSHLQPGEIYVLNISNIEDGEISWDGMDTIDEEYRKVKRYELEVGDLVITCRGTVNKVAVVRELPHIVIASANIIVIRCNKKVISEYVKIFLESPVGNQLVKTFQRGTTVMNINPADLGELEIPLLDLEEQRDIVDEYRAEQQLYLTTIRKATRRWEQKKKEIYSELID